MNVLIKNKMSNKKETSNFILFSLGYFVSVFGSALYTFGVGLYVLRITRSGLSFAITLIFGLVPVIIFNPIAGVLADRVNKKIIIILMDILNGLLFIILYFISLKFNLNLTMIYISIFLTNVFTTFFSISIEAAKPNIVSENKLLSINSISKIIGSVSSITGPFIGGLIFAFIDIKIFILLNGISFIFSAMSEMLIDFKFNTIEKENVVKEGFIADIKEGFKYIKKRKYIVGIFGLFTVINFFCCFSVTVPLPHIVNNVLNLTSEEFGIIQSSFPIGMIIGAILIKKVIEKVSYSKFLIFLSILLSISIIFVAFPLLLTNLKLNNLHFLIYYSIVNILFGNAISFLDISSIYKLQKIVPNEFRGRVLSIGISIGKIITPIALIISGLLLNIIPAYLLPLIGGSLLLVINIIILKFSKIIDLDIDYEIKKIM